MIVRLTDRLVFRQARATLVIGLMLALVTGSFQVVLGFIREQRQTDMVVSQIARMIDEQAAKALYDIDAERARLITQSVLEYPMLRKAELIDDFGVTLAVSERAGTSSPFDRSGFLPGRRSAYEFPLTAGPQPRPVGRLAIYLDTGRIVTGQLSRAVRILAAEAITILLLASVLAFLFYRLVTRPIAKLTRDISLVDMGHPGKAKIETPARHAADELGLLATTANDLFSRFSTTLARARKAEHEARAREKEVAGYRDHLEELVKQRTDELERSHRELEEKRRLADVGALAAALAHRLRTPLGAIQLAAFNIRAKAPVDAGLEAHLANIDKKVAESNQIITNLLMYSSGIKAPAYKRFDLAAALSEYLAAAERAHPTAAVVIKKNFSPDRECFVEADPFMVRELMCNILNNAYDAVGASGTIEAGLDCGAETSKISVRDSGPGMDGETLKRIYDPFFTTKVNGMGIGLKLCLQIARLHGGSIEIDTAVGRGTTVTVILPGRKADG